MSHHEMTCSKCGQRTSNEEKHNCNVSCPRCPHPDHGRFGSCRMCDCPSHLQPQPPSYVFIKTGIIRRTAAGELVIDTCTSDGEHLSAPADQTVEPPRRTCRDLWDEFMPKEWVGKMGRLTVHLSFEEDRGFRLYGDPGPNDDDG